MCKICKKNITKSLMSIFKQTGSHSMCTEKIIEHLKDVKIKNNKKDIKMYLINLFFWYI